MLALGAALGGLVAGSWGIYPAFTIDIFTFLLSAYFIFQVKYQPEGQDHTADKTIGAALQQYLDGLRYLRHHLDVLIISLHKASVSLLVASGFQVLQVRIAEQVFIIGEGGGISLGLIFAFTGIGTGIGPIFARYFTGDRDKALRWAIVLGYIIATIGLLIAAPLNNFSVFLFGTLVRGVGGGIIWVFSTQLLLHLVPNQVRGRVFATEFAFFTLLSAGGAAGTGALMDADFTMSSIILLMAGITLLPGVLWTAWLTLPKPTILASEEAAIDG
jgi:MFS family permease